MWRAFRWVAGYLAAVLVLATGITWYRERQGPPIGAPRKEPGSPQPVTQREPPAVALPPQSAKEVERLVGAFEKGDRKRRSEVERELATLVASRREAEAELSRRLRESRSAEEQVLAIRVFALVRGTAASKAIAEVLDRRETPRPVREEAVRALAVVGGRESFDVLAALLVQEADEGMRRRIGSALVTVGDVGDVGRLERATKDAPKETQATVASVIGELRRKAERQGRYAALSRLDPGAEGEFERLRKALADGTLPAGEKVLLLSRLAETGRGKALELLVHVAQGKHPAPRDPQLAMNALVQLVRTSRKNPDAAKAIETLWTTSRGNAERKEILSVIGSFGEAHLAWTLRNVLAKSLQGEGAEALRVQTLLVAARLEKKR